jgi:hypothetical protein
MGRPPKRMFSLDETSPIAVARFKINFFSACYNVTNILFMECAQN